MRARRPSARAVARLAVFTVARLAITAIVFAALALLAPRSAHAILDPTLIWKTIETPHFRIHTHERLLPVARRIAAISEEAHARLAVPLGWTPREITNVVVTDDTDFANGSASVLPFNTVRLFVTAPDDLSALNDYDDWQVTLVTHEYTHILHVDHILGLPALYNAIFGKQYAPNQIQPRWILEGLAVLLESKDTTGGRIRSTIFDMYLRADVLEENVASIDQISHFPRRWPQGNLWYLYGSHFLAYIDEVYGFEALRQVAADYGDEIIPFGINRAIHRATGKTYVELYEGWVGWMRARYRRQRAEVLARGLREGRRLTFHGQEAQHPRYMPDDAGPREAEPRADRWDRRIAYFRNDAHTTPGLYAIGLRDEDRPRGGVRASRGSLITRTAGPSTPAFLANGELVYDSIETSKLRIYAYWDLFRRRAGDWGDEAVQGERLSFGLRSREPAVSPDGDRVAYVINKAGTSFLYLSELDAAGAPLGPPKKLVGNARDGQIYTPRWSPDGRKIAFSRWHDGGFRDVEIVDVATGALDRITNDRALDTGPVFSPDGRRLFFVSDRTGISNVYAFDLETRALRQVTNVVNGAFQPEIDETGRHLAYVGYTHEGYDLFEIDLDESRWLDAPEYVDRRGPKRPTPPPLDLPAKPYDPWPTFRPYVWELSLQPDAFGQAATVTTRGGDVLGYQAFSASITASFVRGISGTDVTYLYRRMPWDTRVRAYRYIGPRGGYRFGDQTPVWVEQILGFESGIVVPLNRSFAAQNLSINYSFARFKALDGFPQDVLDPMTRLPVFPQTGNVASLRIGWSWSNVQRFLWSIGAEKGSALSVGVDLARPEFGGDFALVVANYSALTYVPLPWFRHHVLGLHASGGTSAGNWGRRGAFAVGGYADIPLPDALRNLIVQPSVALRGYRPAARVGDSFQLFNAEYRFPIWNVDRGVDTIPFFLQRFYGNFFFDYGDATFTGLDLARMKVGVGGEILTDLSVGYFQPITLRLGLARGTSEGGTTQTYVVLSQLF